MTMSFVTKLETMIAGWYKSVPHLPKGGQKWLAQNAWWIVLVGVILSAIAILVTIGGIVSLATLTTSLAVDGIYYATTYNQGWPIFIAVLTLAFTVLIVIVEALAISPLKALKNRGWKMLFLGFLIDAVSVILTTILGLNIIGLIFGLIGLAIGAYFIFEVRSYFALTSAKPAVKK